MKTFHRETIEQGTMLTPARIGFHKIMDRYVEDCPVGYVLAIRLPINRWKTWYCAETHQEKQGMAEYTAYFIYYKWPRKLVRKVYWEPVSV